LVEEEDIKKAHDRADSKDVGLGTNYSKEQEKEIEMDLSILSKKEKNKIINQKEKNAKKAMANSEKEAQTAKDKAEKEAKKGERSG
jgi:hypothetical protein